MAFLHVMVAAVAVLNSLTAEGADQAPRKARNPGLLHLAHAGHSVGSYVGGGGGGGVAGGGPHIVIVGRPAHITTHVASKDSLEELDQEIRQHYGPNASLQGGGHFILPSAGTFRTFPAFHGYTQISSAVGHPLAQGHALTAAPHYSVTPSSVAYAPPHNYAQGVTPTPQSNYAQSATPTYAPASNYAHSATPTSVSYPHGVTAAPLTHTLATPGVSHTVLPGRFPLHPLHSGFHGLGYHQSPVFIPLQALGHQPQLQGHQIQFQGHQPQFQGHHPQFQGHQPHFQGHPGLVLGRVPYHPQQSEQEDDRPASSEEGRHGFYDDTEERRPSHFNRDFDGNSAEKSRENSGYEKSYKFGSDEGFARSAPRTFFRSNPSEDHGSYEESGSHEAESDERAAANTGSYQARALHGDGKVATSYQSVTLETHQPANLLLQRAAQPAS